MRLVFMGTPSFALPSLRRLAQSEHDIVAVVTRPDARAGRGRALQPPPVKVLAQEFGLCVLQPESLCDPNISKTLEGFKPDLFVVVAFQVLPAPLLSIPARGSVNLHASLLPGYRGAAPIQRCIMAGDAETGLTTFLLKPRVDTGDILMQRRVQIHPEETAGDLADRLKLIGADLLFETITGLSLRTITPRPQPPEGATGAPRLSREDARIDWRNDAETIRNQIRGTSPAPGAFTAWRQAILKIYRASLCPSAPSGQPGAIVSADEVNGVVVATSNGGLRLTEVQPAGKRRMSIEEWMRGYRIQVGEKLGIARPAKT